MLKMKLQYFDHLMRRTNSFKRPWCWERLRAGGKGDDRGWDGWMASLTQWTWVWVNSGSWWWTGRPGVLQSTGLHRVGHKLESSWNPERLNWTELNLIRKLSTLSMLPILRLSWIAPTCVLNRNVHSSECNLAKFVSLGPEKRLIEFHAKWIFPSFVVVQLLSCVQLFTIPWAAECQASLSFILLKFA